LSQYCIEASGGNNTGFGDIYTRISDDGMSSRGCEDEQPAREAPAVEAAVQAVASCTDSNSAAFATHEDFELVFPRVKANKFSDLNLP
jgi:hypothetical protein